jgi:hypothetical protein
MTLNPRHFCRCVGLVLIYVDIDNLRALDVDALAKMIVMTVDAMWSAGVFAFKTASSETII